MHRPQPSIAISYDILQRNFHTFGQVDNSRELQSSTICNRKNLDTTQILIINDGIFIKWDTVYSS